MHSVKLCRIYVKVYTIHCGSIIVQNVGNILCRKNADNQLILATLEKEAQKHVAVFNKEKTLTAVPFMDTDFLQWLYQEAVEGRWEKSMVLDAVVKEELEGKTSFSPRIKPGM